MHMICLLAQIIARMTYIIKLFLRDKRCCIGNRIAIVFVGHDRPSRPIRRFTRSHIECLTKKCHLGRLCRIAMVIKSETVNLPS